MDLVSPTQVFVDMLLGVMPGGIGVNVKPVSGRHVLWFYEKSVEMTVSG